MLFRRRPVMDSTKRKCDRPPLDDDDVDSSSSRQKYRKMEDEKKLSTNDKPIESRLVSYVCTSSTMYILYQLSGLPTSTIITVANSKFLFAKPLPRLAPTPLPPTNVAEVSKILVPSTVAKVFDRLFLDSHTVSLLSENKRCINIYHRNNADGYRTDISIH